MKNQKISKLSIEIYIQLDEVGCETIYEYRLSTIMEKDGENGKKIVEEVSCELTEIEAWDFVKAYEISPDIIR